MQPDKNKVTKSFQRKRESSRFIKFIKEVIKLFLPWYLVNEQKNMSYKTMTPKQSKRRALKNLLLSKRFFLIDIQDMKQCGKYVDITHSGYFRPDQANTLMVYSMLYVKQIETDNNNIKGNMEKVNDLIQCKTNDTK